ncbi:MAG: hypothetical protein K6E58_05960 [Eubacterium sp.]|nr:hypothetical protein [Eubacterium sp.]
MEYIAFAFGIIISIIIVILAKKITPVLGRYQVAIIASLLIAIVLEVFTFNFNCFDYSDFSCKKTAEWKPKKQIINQVNPNYSSANIEIKDINAVVKHIEFDVKTTGRVAKVGISYKDKANSISKTLPEVIVVPTVEKTLNISPDFSGKVKEMAFVINAENGNEIRGAKVTLNTKPKMNFSFARVLIVFAIIMLIYIFKFTYRKRYEINTEKSKKKLFKNKLGMSLVILAIIQIVFCISLYNAHDFDFRVTIQGVEKDYFQEAADAFYNGHIDLNDLPYNTEQVKNISKLEKLENPYEKGLRQGIPHKNDYALYKGKYYSYFGIVPTVLAYLPVRAITGEDLNTNWFVLLLMCFVIIAMIKFVYDVSKRKKDTNVWFPLMSACVLINCSFILLLVKDSSAYEVPRLAAVLFSVIGVDLFYDSVADNKIKNWKIVAGAICMALTVGCKPSFIVASLVTFIIFVNRLRKVSTEDTGIIKSIFNKNNVKTLICYVAPYLCVGICLMVYNYMRFDSIFEFGAKYQLTVYDVGTYHLDNFAKIPEMLFQTIFSQPNVSGVFPFLSLKTQELSYLGYQYACSECGILVFPIMWLLLFVPALIKNKRTSLLDKEVVISSLVVGVLMLYITSVMGAIGWQYNSDWAWLFAIPLVFIFLALDQYVSEKTQMIIIKPLMVVVTVTMIITVLLIFCNTGIPLDQRNPELFHNVRTTVMFWK